MTFSTSMISIKIDAFEHFQDIFFHQRTTISCFKLNKLKFLLLNHHNARRQNENFNFFYFFESFPFTQQNEGEEKREIEMKTDKYHDA